MQYLPGNNILEITKLNHYFGHDKLITQTLFDINLTIKAGEIVIMTGPSGSGKTTLGKVILRCTQTDNPDVISADDFFTDQNGVYNFDSSKIKEAHNDCLLRCVHLMKNEIPKIVVANTFTQVWEMEKYYEAAERYKYRIHSVIVENKHKGQNIHDVPHDKIEIMKEKFVIYL